jgi:hypothetical protein
MHDCCRSRKGFGLEERHGINDTRTIWDGFFRTKFRTDHRLSFHALWSILARGFLLSTTGARVCDRAYLAAPGPPLGDRERRAADSGSRH